MVTEIVKDLIKPYKPAEHHSYGPPHPRWCHILGEGDDHQGDDGIEGEVGDGHPVLQARPVTHYEDIEILDAAADGDDNPKDEKAAMPQSSSDEEKDGAEDAKEGIEDAVLDDRTNADVLAL